MRSQVIQHPSFQAPLRQGRRALLLALRHSGQSHARLQASLSELEALAREVGITPIYTLRHTFPHGSHGSVLGRGKQRALRALTQVEPDPGLVALEPPPDLLLVDTSLSAAQQRELARELAIPVLDRSALILELFALRARTHSAKLAVEIARLQHALPRLREDEGHKRGREGGGGGRGERGHTETTLSKQRTRARLHALERELERAQAAEAQQRARRSGLRRVALVGYTNAGKSSWLNALSGASTLVADKPFATLDTTLRRLQGKAAGLAPIVLADTVGFLRDLPHALVPSFRASLLEAREADLLVCVADASDPELAEHIDVCEATLAAVGAADVPRLWLLNKSDRLSTAQRQQLERTGPTALLVSSFEAADVARVRRAIAEHFEVPT